VNTFDDDVDAVNQLGAVWSDYFDANAAIGATPLCALCRHSPCDCPEFGTPEYFELFERRHGR
jgi:hypothetical protein